jgi:hypothetical protein
MSGSQVTPLSVNLVSTGCIGLSARSNYVFLVFYYVFGCYIILVLVPSCLILEILVWKVEKLPK